MTNYNLLFLKTNSHEFNREVIDNILDCKEPTKIEQIKLDSINNKNLDNYDLLLIHNDFKNKIKNHIGNKIKSQIKDKKPCIFYNSIEDLITKYNTFLNSKNNEKKEKTIIPNYNDFDYIDDNIIY